MRNYRTYGNKPINLVLLHGGPGATGSVVDIAIQLSKSFSVLEPFQTKKNIKDQVFELYEQISNHCEGPVVLIGWSWGAWLGYIFASKYPLLVKKLILISSPPFEQKFVENMQKTRISRFTSEQLQRVKDLEYQLNDESITNKDTLFSEFGSLYESVDNYSALKSGYIDNDIEPDSEIYNRIWPQAAKMRSKGEFIHLAKDIQAPVVAIQGSYDPHPYLGVKEPLERVLKDFRMILLERCGHTPWIEKYARKKFYNILKKEILS